MILPLLILACRFLGVAGQQTPPPTPDYQGDQTGAATCSCECYNADGRTPRVFDGAAENDNSCQEDNPDAGFDYNDICCEVALSGVYMHPCCDRQGTTMTPPPTPDYQGDQTGSTCDICMQMNYPSEAVGYLCMDDLSDEIFGDTNGWFTDDKDAGWGEDECQGGDLKWFPYTCQDAEERCRQAGGEHGHGNQTGGKEEKWEIPKVPYAEKLLSVIGASVVAVVGVGIPAVVTAPAILR